MFTMQSIKASKQTSLSTFQMQQQGNSIVVFPGQYFCNNQLLAETTQQKTFEIPLQQGHYELWLFQDGTLKLIKDFVTIDNYIDCLLLVDMPAGAKSLDDAEITFKQFVEVV